MLPRGSSQTSGTGGQIGLAVSGNSGGMPRKHFFCVWASVSRTWVVGKRTTRARLQLALRISGRRGDSKVRVEVFSLRRVNPTVL